MIFSEKRGKITISKIRKKVHLPVACPPLILPRFLLIISPLPHLIPAAMTLNLLNCAGASARKVTRDAGKGVDVGLEKMGHRRGTVPFSLPDNLFESFNIYDILY